MSYVPVVILQWNRGNRLPLSLISISVLNANDTNTQSFLKQLCDAASVAVFLHPYLLAVLKLWGLNAVTFM
jgi:hypothetical protein